ncbi:hypothetical protein BV96_00043 [Sphingomonas paucimobilis]|nr:hypothetical protein BV96_00043 [Sphingomonas paucimobilis]
MKSPLSLMLLFVSLGVSTSALAATPDPSIGTWKLNLEESIAPQGIQFRQYTVVIRSASPEVDWTYSNTDAQGRPYSFTFKGKADGVVRDLPGVPGLKGSMTLLPSGIVDAKLWSADGSYENKFCIMGVSLRKQTCMALIKSAGGEVVFFKQVIDKQD